MRSRREPGRSPARRARLGRGGRRRRAPGLVLVLLAIVSCRPEPAGDRPSANAATPDEPFRLYFGVVAGAETASVFRGYRPLVDALSTMGSYAVQLQVGRSPDDVLAYLEERLADFAELDPFEYVLARRQFGAVPLARRAGIEGDGLERSIVVAGADAGIARLEGLAGRVLALGPPHEALSHLLVRHELARRNVVPARIDSFEDETAVVAAVAEGRADAGAMPDWLAAEAAARGLRVVHRSEPVAAGPVAVRGDLPEAVASRLRTMLLAVELEADAHPRVRNGFVDARDADYDALRRIAAAARGCDDGCHERLRVAAPW